ncbi:hypothetical protein [Tenacibaculum finnmarkense]|uniref:hypothetical protein n=1 Tax=Tenacibaculum finnmarkense TaxID=2781243 RepID=UPI001EFABA10|nr:hypothetical protein [Tenacibaculum finnmarkense]MCG8734624.1 hypothetical protein [Tenacibaculum finnmarkense]
MKGYPFADAILNQTDGGLQIIKDYYPGAASGTSSKKFKIRSDEKTPSGSLKQVKNGVWLVMDYGNWEKPKNALGVCMFEDNLTFGEACVKMAKLYNVQYKSVTHTAKPIITKRSKIDKEVPGSYIFNYKDEISDNELKVIGPLVTNGVANRFKLKSVKSMTYITKSNEAVTTESTDDYPIFVYDFGTWQKIYQPKSTDKAYRFRYAGGRPADYIFGLDDVIEAHRKHSNAIFKEAEDGKPPKKEELKLDKIIIASGDRDALNIASFGHYVIWLNSETATFQSSLFKQLSDLANNVYNLPDIDKTGVRQAVKLGMQFLDLKTIWLPTYLSESKDWRGNPRKDFLDFVNLKHNKEKPFVIKSALNKLITNALPMKFWDVIATEKGMKYVYNIVHAEHFLKHQGFCRMETPFDKEEYCYIFIDGNTIKRTTPNKIENFMNNFLEQRQMSVALRNMVKKTPYLKEAMLSKLPLIEIDFQDSDANTQYWFFKKNVVEIRKSGVKVHKKGVVNKMVIEEKVIDFPNKTTDRQFEDAFQESHFKIGKDANGNLDIDILRKDNKFLNFLINTSRVHWRKELEGSFKPSQNNEAEAYFKQNKFNIAGANLSLDEILEQKQHLCNKIYAIGYLLHKYKVKSKAWFVFGIDNKLSDIGESHGGSGKSLMYDYLEIIMKNQFFIPGRSKKAVDSDFLLDGVTKDTDYVFIDDMNQYFPFEQFFSEITGKMKVNPKGIKGFTINFADSPKLCGTSNFPPTKLDPSTSRRILFTVNSDYYHHNKDGEYEQTRRVSDDFDGKDLFNDFTEAEYLDFYVFCAQAISFYLSSTEKIDPPMNNVNKRNLMAIMGDQFREWAAVYFSLDSGNLDKIISKNEAWKNYKETDGKKGANAFKTSVIAFCKLNEYVFNPAEEGVKDGRILKNIGGKTQECFYIKKNICKTETVDVFGDFKIEKNTETDDLEY